MHYVFGYVLNAVKEIVYRGEPFRFLLSDGEGIQEDFGGILPECLVKRRNVLRGER